MHMLDLAPVPFGAVCLTTAWTHSDGTSRRAHSRIYAGGMPVWEAAQRARRTWILAGTPVDTPGHHLVLLYEFRCVTLQGRTVPKRIRTLLRYGHAEAPDLDLFPDCPACGRICRNVAAHTPLVRPLLATLPRAPRTGAAAV